MDYRESKEIVDLIKHIKNIDEQMYMPDDKSIRKVLKEVQKSIPIESMSYEILSANGDISKITIIDNIDINVLYSKLTIYKSLCKNELLKKCGQELYDEINRKENL